MKVIYKWIAAEKVALKNAIKMIGAVSAVFLIITQSGCSSKTPEPVSKQSFYFDTVCSISVYDMEEMSKEGAQSAIDEAFKLCSHYESLLSRTKEGSDIYKINHAEGKPVDCDPETVEIGIIRCFPEAKGKSKESGASRRQKGNRNNPELL